MQGGSKERLESKLRAIQALKEEQYVGTRQAWEYLEGISNFHDGVDLIVAAINKQLGQSPRYPATPERIVGTCNQVERLYLEQKHTVEEILRSDSAGDDGETDEISPDSVYRHIELLKERYGRFLNDHHEFLFSEESPMLTWRGLLFEYCGHKRDPNALADFLFPIFSEMNKEKEPTDAMLGNSALIKVTLDNSVPEDIISMVKVASKYTDWKDALSYGQYLNISSEIKNSILGDTILPKEQFLKMEGDQALGYFENRRQILTSQLHYVNGKDSGIKGDSNIENYRIQWAERLNQVKERLDKMKGLRSPQVMLEYDERERRFYEFLLRTSAQEINFLRKFLQA